MRPRNNKSASSWRISRGPRPRSVYCSRPCRHGDALIVTVFRARLRPENADAYFKLAGELGKEVETMPGYVSRKVYVAEDGERLTIVEFESWETHRAWAEHPKHRAAQKLGRNEFYAEYSIQICESHRSNEFRVGRISEA